MKKLILLFVLFISLRSTAQNDELGKRTTIAFITSEVIASENFEENAFLAWASATQQAMGPVMQTEKSNCVVKMIADWAKGGKCNYIISICPENPELARKINAALKNVTSPIAKFAPFQLLFVFKFNDGCADTQSFAPVALTSVDKLMLELTSPSLAHRKEVLRNWALQDVIPILSHYTNSVSDQFVGVRNVGTILSGKGFVTKGAAAVTDQNPLYWRGVMEMSKGNMLVSASKVFMMIANDEFDMARRYMNLLSKFADKDGLATHYLFDLNKYMTLFYQLHDSLVSSGIQLHDKGKFDKAIEVYNSILSDYPNSAWARYELYFSTAAKNKGAFKVSSEKTDFWDQNKTGVYKADPLYPMGGGASNSKDAYLLFRHLSVDDLFKDKKKLKEDLVQYADIALDLESYAFAAHVYWYLLPVFGEDKYKGHTLMAYFLYSLQKLGVPEVQSYFKDDYKKEFDIIDKERETAMKNDPMYKSFKEQ